MTSTEPVVVVVVRDPDASNDITVYGADDALVIDVDLGYLDLRDPNEYSMWADGQLDQIRSLPVNHPARHKLADLVREIAEAHRYPAPEGLDEAVADEPAGRTEAELAALGALQSTDQALTEAQERLGAAQVAYLLQPNGPNASMIDLLTAAYETAARAHAETSKTFVAAVKAARATTPERETA